MLTLTKEKRKFSLRRIFGKKDAEQQTLFAEYGRERAEKLILDILPLIPQKEIMNATEVARVLGIGRSAINRFCKIRAFDYYNEEGELFIGAYKLSPRPWLIKRQGLIEYLKRLNS